MKFGIIIETNDPEKAWNGVRFGNASLKKGHEVKIFLMSAGVEIESITHEKYKARNSEGTDVCPISTMNDCIKMVEWADRVITF